MTINPTDGRADKTRQQILRAASHQFARRAYHDVGLDDILSEAELTKGAMYFHFRSKHALAVAIIEGQTARGTVALQDLRSRNLSGLETLIGVINDPSFGPVVALGLGGVLTEVLKDVSYRVAPFDIDTARDMIAELRAAKLFEGYRGKPAADKEALARALVAVSEMATTLAPRLKELDINPVFVGPAGSGVVAADALVVLK